MNGEGRALRAGVDLAQAQRLSSIHFFALKWLFRLEPLLALFLYLLGLRKEVLRQSPSLGIHSIAAVKSSFNYWKYCRFFAGLYLEVAASIFSNTCLNTRYTLDTGGDESALKRTLASGAIIVASHYGNWELACLLVSRFADNSHKYFFYKPVPIRALDNLLLKLRMRFGGQPVPIGRHLAKANHFPKNSIIFILADQLPAQHLQRKSYPVNFLGQESLFLSGAERLSRKLAAPIFYLSVERSASGYTVVKPILLCANPAEEQPGRITQKIATACERNVLKDPNLWLWPRGR